MDCALGQGSLFAFGIGSSVKRHVIEGLVHAGREDPFIMTTEAEAKRKAEQFREYIEAPVLSKIALSYDEFEACGVEPKTHPEVFAHRSFVVYGEWKGLLGGKINVRGLQGNGKPFVKAFDTTMDGEDGVANPALPYLWALKQIERLSDFAVDDSHAEAVMELGLAYNHLTEHSSLSLCRRRCMRWRWSSNRFCYLRESLVTLSGGSSLSGLLLRATSILKSVSVPSGGSNAVPEPSAALLLLLGYLTVLLQRCW